MPRDKDLKRLVRARMTKTGEAYTTARAQVTKKPRTRRTAAGATKAAGPTPSDAATPAVARHPSDAATPAVARHPSAAAAKATPPHAAADPAGYAAAAGMSDDVIQKQTGCSWERWVYALDKHGAAAMSHRDIAALVHTKYKVGPWWTQAVTVGYERIKGLRARGQRRDGSYEAGRSRTYNVPVTTLYEAWSDARTRKRWLTGETLKVRTATAPKSMRLGADDGTIIAVFFTAKGKAKSAVAVAHTKLPDRATGERMKEIWAARLDALGEVLAG